MPLVNSAYSNSGLFRNGHFSTIYSAKIRIKPQLLQERQRITLMDGDFIDLDFSFATKPDKKLAVLLHGLEGNAQRSYIKGQGRYLNDRGWDICGVNYRGCSGEPNLKYYSYNAGKTDDLNEVLKFLHNKFPDHDIVLIGFSLGGNLLLKYLGEYREVTGNIRAGISVSSPLSLKGSLEALSNSNNWVYRTTFLKSLRKKYKGKIRAFNDELQQDQPKTVTSLLDFDNVYTAPAHGFTDAYDYYAKNSSLQFLPGINLPVLILNALNDSFLSEDCYPYEFASNSKNIYLETPKYGGHVGFYKRGLHYYNEERSYEFLNNII